MLSKLKSGNSPKTNPGVIFGVDIGSSKVTAIAGIPEPGNSFRIVGVGTNPAEGFKNGSIVDRRGSVQTIKSAVSACVKTSDFNPSSVYVGISGKQFVGYNTDGLVSVKGSEVTLKDIDRVVEMAKTRDAQNHELMHVLPKEFILDGQGGIVSPEGIPGKRLEVKAHLIYGDKLILMNLRNSFDQAGLNVNGFVYSPLASALACLSEEEKNNGVLLIDIGGEYTDWIIFRSGSVIFNGHIPIGGNHVTNDIKIGLRASSHESERLKVEHGSCSPGKESGTLEVHGMDEKNTKIYDSRLLSEIIEARYSEILELCLEGVNKTRTNSSSLSVVVTGGGANISNLTQLAEKILPCSVRLGHSHQLSGLADMAEGTGFSTAVGLLSYASSKESPSGQDNVENQYNSDGSLMNKVMHFLKESF